MKTNQDDKAAKTYTTPTLDKRAKLIDVAEEAAPILVSGIILQD